jgi:hypothetical protein
MISALDDLHLGVAAPVLLPVGSTGELIAIAVVGHSPKFGAFSKAVTPKVLRCLPPELGDACSNFGVLVSTDFLHWCASAKSFDKWMPPLVGLQISKWQEVEAFDVEGLLLAALHMCAFHLDSPEAETLVAQQSSRPRTSEEARFMDSVRKEVVRSYPGLDNAFQRKFSLTGKGTAGEIDFVGSHYATCYAAINPKSKPVSRIHGASAALWRLARARDVLGFASPTSIELTAWVPPTGLPIYSDQDYQAVSDIVFELQEQAKLEALDVFAAATPQIASLRLLQMEILETLPIQ